jgi:hypothetical protein
MNNNQRINQLLMQTRGLSSTDLAGTALIEQLRKEAFALAAWSCREIDRITAERDEARVYASAFMYMNMVFSPKGKGMNQETYADEMGWDCFKRRK